MSEHRVDHLQRARAPLFDDPGPVRQLGDDWILGLRLVRLGQLLRREVEVPRAGIDDFPVRWPTPHTVLEASVCRPVDRLNSVRSNTLGHDRLEFPEVHSISLRTTNLPLSPAVFPGMAFRFLTTNEQIYPTRRFCRSHTKTMAGPLVAKPQETTGR